MRVGTVFSIIVTFCQLSVTERIERAMLYLLLLICLLNISVSNALSFAIGMFELEDLIYLN